MAIKLIVKNLQKKIPINPKLVKQKARRILSCENILDAELSIVFLTDQRMHTLNKKYLYHDYPTDVLSFDLSPHESRNKKIEGEIFVSGETAYRNAKLYNAKPKDEATLYVVHGILHLLGYKDKTRQEEQRMRIKEKQILQYLSKK